MVNKTDVEAAAPKDEIPHDHLFKVTGLSSTNLEKLAQDPGSDFEGAISATGYGWFNISLMLCTLPAFWSAVSVTSAPSFIYTRAQCDMELSLLDMGTVSAMTYIGYDPAVVALSFIHAILHEAWVIVLSVTLSHHGMISSAVVWGFLSDTLGRKHLLVWGFFCSGLMEITAAMSQSYTMLLVTRFSSGFLFNGPFAVLITYIAELHRTDLRARVILLTGLFFTIANTTLPLLAWGILPNEWNFSIFGNTIVIHSWNFFLLATAMVPLLAGVAFLFLPESPKFLMSRGRNEEALEVFRKIYTMNTGKQADTFSITKLHEEKSQQRTRGIEALKGGGKQFAPLFKTPYFAWLVLLCGTHSGCMFGANTIRLWYPQLAAMIESDGASLCSAISPQSNPEIKNCVPIETDMLTYLQSSVVGAGSVLTYSIGGALINRCGKKLVAGVCVVLSAVLISLLPAAGARAATLVALITAALALTALGGAALSSIAVDLFPTSLRVMTMAIFLMTGRVGTITGTVIFPALINYGCLPPFLVIGAVLSVCGLSCFFLPNTTLKKLE